MKLALLILSGLLALAAIGCDRRKAATPTPAANPPAKREWTPEHIVKDPKGYLNWSTAQVNAQLADRQKKIDAIADRRKEFEDKQKLLEDNIGEVEKIRKYLAEACQRADDLDQWPARMGGRTFTREKARTILDQTKAYVDERKPLLGTYDQLLRKMDDSVASLRGDIGRLTQFREKLALDMAQVQLDETSADVDKLRKTEQQLASMSGAVASLQEDALTLAPPKEPPGRVNVEEMLK